MHKYIQRKNIKYAWAKCWHSEIKEKKQKIKLKITEMSNNATTFFFLS